MYTFDLLKEKFNYINSLGFQKGVNNNRNSAGITLESLLGSSGYDFNIPDFYDIEIKAIRKYFKAEFDLFNSAPDGSVVNGTKWVSEKFGYPDKDYKNIKVFKGDIYCNKLTRIGIFYLFRLKINYQNERIYLEVLDKNYRIISRDIYWDFDTLRDKLERKLSKLGIFGFDKKLINNDIYYHYNDLKMYKLKSFEAFLQCIEKGIIYVTFKTGVNKTGKYAGKFTDHGTSFRISKINLYSLFDRVQA